MKSDLHKLMDGEKIYRHEDQKALAHKWETIATVLQFSALAGLFIMAITLNAMDKEQARHWVWPMAGALIVYATIAFFVARKALNYRMTYLRAEGKRVGKLIDESIEELKEN